jgi:tRNA pseudouridine55 synthase
MQDIFVINKPCGLTPLQALTQLKSKYPQLSGIPLTYAGRLDPIAEGVLLALSGEEILRKEYYLNLPKTYLATIAIGYGSDSFDILGMPERKNPNVSFTKDVIENALKVFIGNPELPLPPYSSVPINGKPLFEWARSGRLSEIKIPTRQTHIKTIEIDGILQMSNEEFISHIKFCIDKVKGDFRQDAITQKWERLLLPPGEPVQLVQLYIECSSGTYVRSIANELGIKLGNAAVLSKLIRTSIGEFKIEDSILLE